MAWVSTNIITLPWKNHSNRKMASNFRATGPEIGYRFPWIFTCFPMATISCVCQGTTGSTQKQLEFETCSPLCWQTWCQENSRRTTLEAIWWIPHAVWVKGWVELHVFFWGVISTPTIKVCPAYVRQTFLIPYSLQVGSLLSEYVTLGPTNWQHTCTTCGSWCCRNPKLCTSCRIMCHHFGSKENSQTHCSARCRPSVPGYRWW